ncbi:helix-turn-helix domain-containing protein [Aestuariibaculum suncheonense]|uniref:Helix-turn-helix transcriptional regulator n=1 Tax=Aestuariibaculum suncheonense TaxID=1028745 RepID=A0A8J6Q658_9FLAO|nr:helix-turn-helix transcriptional regulator [Aestuariibaculum suncheonense]MBD0834460.1 helix-turn-helix transcriptional regulator [Aestuariibaculum suncheonense]
MAVDPKKNTKSVYTQEQLLKIGERLKELRIQKGFSNYENFAFSHDLPRSQYGRYENGEDMRLSSLIKVLEAMGVTLEEFFNENFK